MSTGVAQSPCQKANCKIFRRFNYFASSRIMRRWGVKCRYLDIVPKQGGFICICTLCRKAPESCWLEPTPSVTLRASLGFLGQKQKPFLRFHCFLSCRRLKRDCKCCRLTMTDPALLTKKRQPQGKLGSLHSNVCLLILFSLCQQSFILRRGKKIQFKVTILPPLLKRILFAILS